MSKFCKSRCMHKLLQTNIAVGLLVFITAVFFIISGEYASLETRQHAESLLNITAFGGLMYSVISWYLDLAIHPQLSEPDSNG